MAEGTKAAGYDARPTSLGVDVDATIRERLLLLATPEVVDRLVRWALADDGRASVPDAGPELDAFVREPLRRVVSDALGEDAAEAIVDELRYVLRTIRPPMVAEDSQVRLSIPAPMLTLDGDPPSTVPTERLPFDPPSVEGLFVKTSHVRPSLGAFHVVLATRSTKRNDDLVEALGPTFEVHRVDDVFELVDVAASLPGDRLLVVADAASATVKASTLAAVSGELPEGTRVVVWGSSDREEHDLHALVSEVATWSYLGAEATSREVAYVIRATFEDDFHSP